MTPPPFASWLARCLGALLIGCAPLAAAAAPATPSPITRQLLDERPVAGVPGMKTTLWRIEYAPGASAPSHHHPVAGIGYVLEGEFESAFAGQPLTRVGAGQSFVDLPGVEHRVFRNASAERPLKFVIAYTIAEGTPTLELSTQARPQLKSAATPLTIRRPALYPETLELNPLTQRFLVGSLREGSVYEVDGSGQARPLVADEQLTAVLGIAVDAPRKRLWVTNSDLGLSVRSSARGPRKEAGVGLYDLGTGQRMRYTDLSPLLPSDDHLINGVTVDAQGNAYATDSLAAAIYEVTAAGSSRVLLQDTAFRGAGVHLNGITAHPDGYLLAIDKSAGALYRIPLADPRGFQRVQLPRELIGGDGLLLVDREHVVVTANSTPTHSSQAAFVLESRSGWLRAHVAQELPLGEGYPTTMAARSGKLFYLATHLDEWLAAPAASRDALARRGRQGEIREIGTIPLIR
jgi:quercetin dioxygenase-like cupin family protein